MILMFLWGFFKTGNGNWEFYLNVHNVHKIHTFNSSILTENSP